MDSQVERAEGPQEPSATGDAAALALLFSLHQRALRAADLKELGFVIANETWQLMGFRQAVVFFRDRLGQPSLESITGLVSCSEDTPYTQWLNRLVQTLDQAFPDSKIMPLAAPMLDDSLREGWLEWWPAAALMVPLHRRGGERVGCVFLLRDAPWTPAEQSLLANLAEVWSHCAAAFLTRRFDWQAVRDKVSHWGTRRRWWMALAVIVLFPVRISAVAPAEIIPLQAEAITAPMDGVVQRFEVPPNAVVKAGETLFSLDDTTLRNRKAVAEKALAVARADALAAQQKAFDNAQSRAELASLMAQVREREAELAFVNESLGRIEFKAPQDGVFVYADPNDWIGKPVVTGERIGQIAQPNDLGVLVWLPVGDAINLELGADMRMFTQTSPLSALNAELIQTSYQATQSPEGVMSYRIRGKLAEAGDARIGLRGTAKVYGQWRPLVYWVLRRPLGALRQFLGV